MSDRWLFYSQIWPFSRGKKVNLLMSFRLLLAVFDDSGWCLIDCGGGCDPGWPGPAWRPEDEECEARTTRPGWAHFSGKYTIRSIVCEASCHPVTRVFWVTQVILVIWVIPVIQVILVIQSSFCHRPVILSSLFSMLSLTNGHKQHQDFQVCFADNNEDKLRFWWFLLWTDNITLQFRLPSTDEVLLRGIVLYKSSY